MSMDYHSIDALQKVNPAILALRKDWLPLAISFLYLSFKRKHEVQVSRDLLREKLDSYLENLNTTLSEDRQYHHDADYYLERWSREDDLIRIRNRENDYVVQLSPHAERLIGWFEEMQTQGMIGTESRLRTIQSLLDEVVSRSTEDIEARLQQLHERRYEIEAEIKRIQETQHVESFTDIQIRERLDHISNIASQLIRDFSRVEESFREMARSIQQAQLNPKLRRGEILGTALDADEQLEMSDEGQSFRAFYELLTHPEQRSKFDTLVKAVFQIPRLEMLVGDNTTLKYLTTYLLESGENVNQSNQRLAEHLRRVVDTRNITESRRVQALSRDIKHIANQFGANIAPIMTLRTFCTIEGEPAVEMPLERPLFDPPNLAIASERPRVASALIVDDMLASLYDTFYIDKTFLYSNIERLLMSRTEITLPELLSYYPIRHGVSEIVTYLFIASHEPQHTVDRTQQDSIVIQMLDGIERRVTIPHVVFRRRVELTEEHHD